MGEKSTFQPVNEMIPPLNQVEDIIGARKATGINVNMKTNQTPPDSGLYSARRVRRRNMVRLTTIFLPLVTNQLSMRLFWGSTEPKKKQYQFTIKTENKEKKRSRFLQK